MNSLLFFSGAQLNFTQVKSNIILKIIQAVNPNAARKNGDFLYAPFPLSLVYLCVFEPACLCGNFYNRFGFDTRNLQNRFGFDT
ncbi:MAG: hypothetical protein QG657_4827 [Acidobacteriota bacterium]|nr:hypothetical protein [Acidobacteriota bacterium]